MHDPDSIDQNQFFNIRISASNELHFKQSFEIENNASFLEENINDDIDPLCLEWKRGSIIFTRFLVYMDKNSLYFTILQKNDIVFRESIFTDLKNPTQFDFELFSESKFLKSLLFFVFFFVLF